MAEKLFETAKIGAITLKNRCFIAALATRYPDSHGRVTSPLLAYYAHLALVGAGLVFVEAALVSPEGRGWSRELSAAHDECVPGLAEIAESIHERGAVPFLQIHHAGRQGLPESDGTVVGASAIPCPILSRPVRELTTDEVKVMIEKYVKAAQRARQAGFPGIELHGAHGYLLHQFVSPLTNFREDEYRLTEPGISRFPLDIVRAIKQVEPGLAVSYRLSARDYLPRGLMLRGAKNLAKALEKAGADFLSVSGGMYASLHGPDSLLGRHSPQAVFRDDARDIREAVAIPVGVTGKIQSPGLAEEILENRDAHFIGLGRMILRDPEWITKCREGQGHAVRPCLLCARCKYHQKGCPDDGETPVWIR
jgi:2,4-dienoyl-CoA reductase-like NADH-dependent reductase (Old Yellow Enzyme family)